MALPLDGDVRVPVKGSNQSIASPLSKSWLFEVVNLKQKGTIEESFTLVMPPQSVTIREKHRVSITKTFGNAFIDDYGPDNMEITIKGISGTAHAFPTFRTKGTASAMVDIQTTVWGANQAGMAAMPGRGGGTGYTGREAFYEFRNKIIRYKDAGNWQDKELRVYDLADQQAYKCILLEFSLDRTNDQPLRYPFTISLFVYERLDKRGSAKLNPIPIAKQPESALNQTDRLLDKIEEAYRNFKEIMNKISLLKAQVLNLRTRWNQFLTQTRQIVESPLDVSRTLIETAFAAVGTVYDTYLAGKMTLERYQNCQEMMMETLRQGLGIYGYTISEGGQITKTLTMEADNGLTVPDVGDGVQSKAISPKSYTFSGLILYSVRGEDTLQSIAQDQLGDENLWPYIAAVNEGIATNDDLVVGSEIYIPTQASAADVSQKDSYILTEDTARDPYGSDIRIDQNGDLVFQENGDLALINGVNNVLQSVDLRLNTVAGTMIKQTAFGLSSQIGAAGTIWSLSYLRMSIKAALIEDPRIKSIDNMMLSVKGDAIYISMDIQIVGYDKTLPVNTVM